MLRNSTKFARVWDAFFKKKSVPKVNDYRNIILEKGASGTFFDGLKSSITFVTEDFVFLGKALIQT